MLTRLVAQARAGRGGALVVAGEAGTGVTALLENALPTATDVRVLRVVGAASERRLPFAALHRLCAPLRAEVDRLPEPLRSTLLTVLTCRGADVALDEQMVGVALVELLAHASGRTPLVCAADDWRWWDAPSRRVLAFAARRVDSLRCAVVLAVRDGREHLELDGLPRLRLAPLGERDAAALLDARWRGPLDPRVRDRVVVEARGNPRALVTLPQAATPAALAGGWGAVEGVRVDADAVDEWARRSAVLPRPARAFLLIAATDSTGDPALLWTAAASTGAEPPAPAGLVEVGARVRFPHSLDRCAVYRSASPRARRAAHRALAEAAGANDVERRAWHRAAAASTPDEGVAADLASAAHLVWDRGGAAARAAFLERAAHLTPDRATRAARAVEAAAAHCDAGSFDAAAVLLGTVGPHGGKRWEEVRDRATRARSATDRLTGLTGRERDVAVLVAAGATSREVGERLVLSTRTVDAHLRSIFRKLGIRSRRELRDLHP
ncbi:AAA ATPase domain-containing protein [Lentzea xinjiangensis]|uniref:AAA ATPase domain-containing protein n=1 Tax=Lentzea xinjiangensis TaxID=402600 RepID=A0A1H9QJ97_9PSEU|nr:AAA ATPase domain-containing protein [Lentzea xinjiangensis]